MLRTRHDDKAYQVVEVRTGEEFLAHSADVLADQWATSTFTCRVPELVQST